MSFTEEFIASIAPNPAAFKSGKSLSGKSNWQVFAKSDRALWGEIKGSGKNPYLTQIDLQNLAYKCSCPSRQFPCKHSIGLLLLYTQNTVDFQQIEEPEWVKTWLDKRENKSTAKEEKEKTPEEIEKQQENKEKTLQERLILVQNGVNDLELWLKDLVRIGIIDLPNKSSADIEKMAMRMVDAKASGLASWVRAFHNLNFENQTWQHDAITLIGKIYAIIQTFKNYENLSKEWQITIRNIVGWSQSPKELASDSNALCIKDLWLVAGQHITRDNDLTTYQNWLIGLNTNQKALVLNFSSKYAPSENTLIAGTVLEAELAFFPSVFPLRAIVKMSKSTLTEIPKLPQTLANWNEVFDAYRQQLLQNLWLQEMIFSIENVRITKDGEQWVIYDNDLFFNVITPDFEKDKILKWLSISGNDNVMLTAVLRDKVVMPLGFFYNQKYWLL